MDPRIANRDFYNLVPETPKALRGLGEAVKKSGLEIALIELVKIRASQINGCAFCLAMHTDEARAMGESDARMHLLSAWREAPVFSARERAALAWTEALTRIADAPVSDELYREARAQFTDAELANLTTAIVTINAWNRIAIAYRFMPDVKAQGPAAPAVAKDAAQ
jgi:AhpD family alkylhydroperoxidase